MTAPDPARVEAACRAFVAADADWKPSAQQMKFMSDALNASDTYQWRDMESAPKNQTDILLRRSGLPPIVAGWFQNNEEGGWFSFDDPAQRIIGELMGWMPLPPTPADAAGGV